MRVDEYGEPTFEVAPGHFVHTSLIETIMAALARGTIFRFSSDGSLMIDDPTNRLADDYRTMLQESYPYDVETILAWLRDTDGTVH